MTAERAALVAKMLASVEQSVLTVGWTVAAAQAAPHFAAPIGRALREIVEAGVLLDLCARLSQPDQPGTQDLRPCLARGGAIPRASTRAMNTTTRDCTSGRRKHRRIFQGVPALAPANVR